MIACQRMSAHLAAIALLKSSAAAIFVRSLTLTHALTHSQGTISRKGLYRDGVYRGKSWE